MIRCCLNRHWVRCTVNRSRVVEDSYYELNALGPDLKRTIQARVHTGLNAPFYTHRFTIKHTVSSFVVPREFLSKALGPDLKRTIQARFHTVSSFVF